MNGLLHDINGHPSGVRVALLLAVGTACTAVLAPMFGYGEQPGFLEIAAITGPAFAAKVYQRGVEERGRMGREQ